MTVGSPRLQDFLDHILASIDRIQDYNFSPAFPQATGYLRKAKTRGLSKSILVDATGIEPVTPAV